MLASMLLNIFLFRNS